MKNDTWYVMVDGTHADPADVVTKDGKLQHGKTGVAVALRDNGHPLTSGVATKSNKAAADADPAKPDAEKTDDKSDQKAGATAKEAKPDKDDPKAAYKTRDAKVD